MAEAYPLHWPTMYPRARERRRARFETSFAVARDGIFKELKWMYATGVVLSTNVELNRSGVPYAGRAQPKDPGVAVYFLRDGRRLVLACDEWDRVEDNLQAIRLSLQAMRGLERWACSDILNRAFQGFTALPPPGGTPTEPRPWWVVMDCERDTPMEKVLKIYRAYAKIVHPDNGGSAEDMAELNRAMAEARVARGVT